MVDVDSVSPVSEEPAVTLITTVSPTTCVPEVGVTEVNDMDGELASTPGAVPDAIVVISVPAFPAESCSVMDTGSAPESDLSVFPSTTVYVMV